MGDILAAIQRDLSRRFATDYRIVAADDPDAISVRDSVTGQEHSQTAAGLFVLIGADPHSDWLAETVERDSRGFLLTGADLVNWSLDRPPLPQETSTPGVLAADDVRHGSLKRVASAVGEGASAIQQVHRYSRALTCQAKRT
jgi:thioredoxin reductase (NADPH)